MFSMIVFCALGFLTSIYLPGSNAVMCYRCVGTTSHCETAATIVDCGALPFCRLVGDDSADPQQQNLVHQGCGKPNDCPDGITPDGDGEKFRHLDGSRSNAHTPAGATALVVDVFSLTNDESAALGNGSLIYQYFSNRNVSVVCCPESGCNCVGAQCFNDPPTRATMMSGGVATKKTAVASKPLSFIFGYIACFTGLLWQ